MIKRERKKEKTVVRILSFVLNAVENHLLQLN